MARHGQRESHTFSKVPRVETRRSMFDQSRGYKTTFNEGQLIPFMVQEVVPGDTHKVNANLFARLATLKKPIMDNLYLETFFFFVPMRLLWVNWERMWGAQDNPGDSTDYLVPQVIAPPGASVATHSLWDYFGIPVGVPDLWISALYPRAYNLIYNQWFRDQNLQDSVAVPTGDGPDDPTVYTIQKRGKRHDYFTSALPWPQKGPEVLLPIGGTAPVEPDPTDPRAWFQFTAPGGPLSSSPLNASPTGAPGTVVVGLTETGGGTGAIVETFWTPGKTGLEVDLGSSAAVSINAMREAIVAQQFYEMLARGGTRYVELLQAVYGVSNGDARLQRPEYLGGGRTMIMVNPVVNTAGMADANAQGDLAAYGVASSSSDERHGFMKSFTEHGILMGILCVRADLNYQQGILRQFHRRSKFDFLIPHFAHLGEQAIYNQEIFAQGANAIDPATGQKWDEKVFGYVSRYDDYRFMPSLITGAFRSTVSSGFETLDFWHLAQDFEALPALSPTFIVEAPPVDRIVTVPTEPHFLLDSWIAHSAIRELPMYSVPGLRRI